VDNSGTLADVVSRGLDAKLDNGQPEFDIVEVILRPAFPDSVQQDLRARINASKLDAYLWIPQDRSRSIELHLQNPGTFNFNGPLSRAVNQAVISERLSERGIHLGDMKKILGSKDLKVLKVSETGEAEERGQTVGIANALVVLLYTALLLYGVITMRSVLEEKTTRTMEVLISVVRPFELLCGKILGVAAVAFTQFAIWMISVALLFSYGALAKLGIGEGSPIAMVHVPISLVLYAAMYFVGGYFLYSSMFAAIGAASSNEQDAQQLQWLAMAPLIFCMLISTVILSDPASEISVVLSEIPFFSPVLMALRISLNTPPGWQIVLSVVLLLLAIVGTIYASAKIYRVGILMYGKRPSLVEMFRWLRYS